MPTERPYDMDVSRPRLEAYGRLSQPTIPELLGWGRKLVIGVFALVGAISLGRASVRPFLPAAPQSTPSAKAPSAPATPPQAFTQATPQYEVAVNSDDRQSAFSSGGDIPLDFEAHKAAAEEELKARMPEIDGLQYRDVKTILSSANGQPMVDFCGEVNSLNPMGAYIGFQKFISSRFDAKIEQGTAPGEFAQAWQQHCTGPEGPKIWN